MLIEEVVINHLKNELNIPVLTEIPPNPPEKYVTIQRIESGKRNKIKAVTILIQAYEESKYKAALLSAEVEEAMEDIVENDLVFSCELGGGSDNTDTVSKRYRYETIWNIYY